MSNVKYVLNPEELSDKQFGGITITSSLFWIRYKRKMKNPLKVQRLKYYQNDYIRNKKNRQTSSTT